MVLGGERSPRTRGSKDGKIHVLGVAGRQIYGNRQGNRQHRISVFSVGRSIQYARAWQGHGDRYWNNLGFVTGLRSEDGDVLGGPHSLSNAVLYPRHGRPNRRPQHRLEGPRNLGNLQFLHAQIHGNQAWLRGAYPSAAKSVGELA